MAKKKDDEETQEPQDDEPRPSGPAHEPTPDRSDQSPHEPTAE